MSHLMSQRELSMLRENAVETMFHKSDIDQGMPLISPAPQVGGPELGAALSHHGSIMALKLRTVRTVHEVPVVLSNRSG